MKKPFFSHDPIQERRDEIEKIESTEYKLPKRTDMTLATNTSKLVKFNSMNICCFSMRQKSQSRAIRRFSGMVSSFHMGGKMDSDSEKNHKASRVILGAQR